MSDELLPAALSTFSAVIVECGQIRRMWYEAPDEPAARAFCLRINAGYGGPSDGAPRCGDMPPVAYDETTARRLLGNISKSSLYRLCVAGKLTRLPSGRVLITRESLERFARGAASP